MNSKQVGNWGERIAEDYLRDKGYQILDRNYSFRIPGNPQKGEIDVIAQKSGIISFIEVKTLRGRVALINPEEKVDFGKQRKLVKTSESWLMKKKIPLDTKWQIDVIAIIIKPNKKVEISHFENAVGE
ncbi:MAG: hypothetical protein AUK06_01010 [Parcubacteria group bacterium CG2_30_36_18]|nr:MAG: hypothetical protein AUK06_01010 [Parcubacteria group bacterium CG2_30_36_18]